ncbi:alkaline phosphatase family protein [Flavobacterium piscinae]|uniref:Alkaline phosphatase family protein n=2 Tax=Flavobacterium piscinae TaxID=2506424 RepID=A0A4Q1KRH7_9FLAO|nr:alkaline phosphatase family protein [Flavobacterium piscinae]
MKNLSYLKPIFTFFCLGILITSLSRFFLFIYFFDRVSETQNYWYIFPIGFRFDIIVFSYLSFLPFLALTFIPERFVHHIQKIINFYFLLFLILILLTEIASVNFISQYDTRPNRIFIDYLIYPKEVFGTLLKSYFPSLILTFLCLLISIYLGIKKSKQLFKIEPIPLKMRLILMPIILFLLIFGARSSLTSKRPINASNAVFSTDQMTNSLGLNSLYTLGFAIYSIKNETDISKLYGKMNIEEANNRVKKYMTTKESGFPFDSITFLHMNKSDSISKKKYNVVIILEESLGAEFVGSLGGLPLTPEFDKLTKEGLLYTNLYCTGTRSVRGIEAVISGFLPSPSESVVKLSNSQEHFFTLASVYKNEGYDTSFIYGGMANFDNMASFFNGNGFDNIIDETDFDQDNQSYALKGTWGYSDEDLVTKANQYFISLKNKPFFSLLFSTSNHEPFEYPDGRIILYEKNKNTVNNAIKYADFSIGKFFELAKKEAYYKNTLFVIIADHNTRTYGKYLVPIKKFRIPALIIGPNVPKGMTFNLQSSQIDIPPTLLSYSGVNIETPMIGRSIFEINTKTKGRSIMQFHDNFAFRVENDIIILQPKSKPLQFKVINDSILKPSKLNVELSKDALAHLIVAQNLYKTRTYRLRKN